ncbi:MAG TPA: hypothetical protein VGD67_18905 [Pseudonocardiaceae bacterium]
MTERGAVEERDPLLDEVAAMFQVLDPMPEHVFEAALAAPEVVAAWRDLDAGLLAILDDTALQPLAGAGVRTVGGPRLVTFGSAEDPEACSVEVEVGVEPSGTLRLVGLVVPTGPGELEVRHPGGAQRVPVDELGRFRAEGVPAGPLSLVLHGTDRRTTTTDWITV